MATTKVFRSGNSLAVRLPREIALPEGTEVVVSRLGDSLIVAPARLEMKALVARLALPPTPAHLARPRFKAPKRDWTAEE